MKQKNSVGNPLLSERDGNSHRPFFPPHNIPLESETHYSLKEMETVSSDPEHWMVKFESETHYSLKEMETSTTRPLITTLQS